MTVRRVQGSEVEYTDLNHPVDRWIKFPGPNGGLVPLQDHLGGKDAVVEYTLKRPLGRPQTNSHVEAQPEAPPRLV